MLDLLLLSQSPNAVDVSEGLSLDPLDAHLNRTLLQRGWGVLSRTSSADIYEWTKTLTPTSPIMTCCIVLAPDRGAIEEYMVETIDGHSYCFEKADDFLSMIDLIEAVELPK